MVIPASWRRVTRFGYIRKLHLSRIFLKRKSLRTKCVGVTHFFHFEGVHRFDVSTLPTAFVSPNRSSSQNLAAKKIAFAILNLTCENSARDETSHLYRSVPEHRPPHLGLRQRPASGKI